MTQRLSTYKVSNLLELYLKGHSQCDIANKINVDQSTVSLYISKFKHTAKKQGVKKAGEDYEVMDEIQSLHSLASELKKANLTAEEAKIGLKIHQVFQKYEIEDGDYNDLIQACTKMKKEGFFTSAIKLNQLEKKHWPQL